MSPTKQVIKGLFARSKSVLSFHRFFGRPNEEELEEESWLLFLDDEALGNIVSFLDYNSFYSLLFVCKRLNFIASNSDNWSESVLQRRALCFIHLYLTGTAFTEDDIWTRNYLSHLLLVESAYLCNTLQAVTFQKIEDVWTKFGPVAGKLYSFLCKFNERKEKYPGNLVGGSTCLIKTKTFNFALSQGDLDLVIATFHDTNADSNYSNYMKISATFANKKITFISDRNGLGLPIGKTSEISYKMNSLRSIADVIQHELGDTTQPVDPEFLKWFLENVPDNPSPANADHKLLFQEKKHNELPCLISIEPCLVRSNDYLVSEYEKQFKKLSDLFPEGEDNRDELGKCVSLIMIKYGRKGLGYLQQAYKCLLKVQEHYRLHVAAQEILCRMALRINFQSLTGHWGPEAISSGQIETKVNFQLTDNQILTVSGKAKTKIKEYLVHPIYSDQTITFGLPDGEEIIVKPFYYERKPQIDFSVLNPVTSFFQECIDKSCFSNEPPIVENAVVLDFFICTLKGMKRAFHEFEPLLKVQLDTWYLICEQYQCCNVNADQLQVT